MKRALLIILLVMLGALPTLAQSDCANNLPCGGVPWRLPALPALRSPTPFPTIIATSASGFVPTATGTLTATPTPTAPFDLGQLNNNLATMGSIVQATPEGVGQGKAEFDLGATGGQVVGYFMGLQNVHFGIFTPFVSFLFFAFFTIIGSKLATVIVPVVSAVVGVLRKIIQVILDFLPG